ncbi:uncharacterized protein LOC136041709 isoform X1 [Artemia franciscana]|uniref:uncharacterized protein LOC136041709 isoform X1 n=1 Tax=Artemia franciscana TaxID=6661 RepID=UPI0032DB3EAE
MNQNETSDKEAKPSPKIYKTTGGAKITQHMNALQMINVDYKPDEDDLDGTTLPQLELMFQSCSLSSNFSVVKNDSKPKDGETLLSTSSSYSARNTEVPSDDSWHRPPSEQADISVRPEPYRSPQDSKEIYGPCIKEAYNRITTGSLQQELNHIILNIKRSAKYESMYEDILNRWEQALLLREKDVETKTLLESFKLKSLKQELKADFLSERRRLKSKLDEMWKAPQAADQSAPEAHHHRHAEPASQQGDEAAPVAQPAYGGTLDGQQGFGAAPVAQQTYAAQSAPQAADQSAPEAHHHHHAEPASQQGYEAAPVAQPAYGGTLDGQQSYGALRTFKKHFTDLFKKKKSTQKICLKKKKKSTQKICLKKIPRETFKSVIEEAIEEKMSPGKANFLNKIFRKKK